VTAAVLALLLAHESTVSASRLELGEHEVRATFTFSMEDLGGLARLDLDGNGTVEVEEWRRVLPAIVDYVGRKFRIENCASDGDLDALPPALPVSQGRAPVTVVLRYRSSRPLERLDVHCTLFDEHGGNPRHVAELSNGRTIVFDRDRKHVEAVSPRTPGIPAPAVLVLIAALLVAAAVTGGVRKALSLP
jgi:hypothetical protein